MAKKRAVGKKRQQEDSKAELKVRLDRDLHEALVKLSDASGISLNQLMQGMVRGLVGHSHVGQHRFELECDAEDEDGRKYLTTEVEKGIVWFGWAGCSGLGAPYAPGQLWFWIDTRERGDVHHL